MFDALYISAMGLQAQKERLDASAANLANLGTPAYKRQTVDFSAILDRPPMNQAASAGASPQPRPHRLLRSDLTQGDLRATGRALDVAINGAGFIEVDLPGGGTGYSRAGALQLNAEGGLSLASGHGLKADLRVPPGAIDLQIQRDGSVTATVPGARAVTVVGQIELANFSNPDLLQYRGEGIFVAPDGGAEPVRARPGEEGAGLLVAGSLEGANVRMEDEMVALMLMQRIYELNSRVLQAADGMMGMSNNMRQG